MKIGFIGLGAMGSAMVPHLIAAGHQVGVWNRSPGLLPAGATPLATAAAAFDCDAVITMLADDTAVRSVLIDSAALSTARAGCVHVMMATISLALVEELLTLHDSAGVAYVAAPVFGVPAVAAAAQLNILVAGAAADVARVQPLFDVLGKKSWFLGTDARQAHVAKLAGNLMITLAIEAMAEATALTESYGLKAADFLNVVTNTMFASPSYQRYGAYIGRDSYEPGFKLTLGLKDVKLALDAARARQITLPAAAIVRDAMVDAVAQGLGAKDWSVLARTTQQRCGLGQ